ncbi:MAG: hypothetical protein E6Q73_09710 [Pseudorhodobacter sp.]|nr:MAG: hypothetical protein E6Q73_09710 [Pseudorhodobacter sp.]
MLADLALDHRLAALRQAAEAKARSETALAGLAKPVALPQEGFEGVSIDLSGLAYQRWADVRRSEINLVLAGQTHAWLAAKDEAQLAFGKSEALRRLVEKQRRGK